MIAVKIARRGLILLVLLVCCLSFSPALAQRKPCPVGGFSLDLPDSFTEQPLSGEAPDLCFYWKSDRLSIQAYVLYLGEVAGSDLFQVLTGSETDSGTASWGGVNMLYASGVDAGGAYRLYSWMDRGNNVTLYFYYTEGDASAPGIINDIMGTISFDAGH